MYRRGFPLYSFPPSFDSTSISMDCSFTKNSTLAELPNLASMNLSAALLVLKLGNEGLSDLVKPVLEPNCSLNHVSLSKDNLNS